VEGINILLFLETLNFQARLKLSDLSE